MLKLLYEDFIIEKNRYKKSMWIRKLFEEREQKDELNMLIKDMKLFDSEWFFGTFVSLQELLDSY